jgi:hypothetical protein
MAEERGGLLTAGGVLSIIAGVFQLLGGIAMAVLLPMVLTFLEEIAPEFGVTTMASHTTFIVGCVIGVLGIVALVGGIHAVRRGRYGLALAGAICSLPSHIFGILAIIFVAVARREFGASH